MAENVDKKNAWQSYYDEHKAAADRILGCEPSDYAQILGLEEPVSIQDVYKAFERLSNLLSPECSQGNPQYKLAQKAHDRLWKAARSHGADMEQYYGNNENPPVFPTCDDESGANGVKSAEDSSSIQCVHCDSYQRPNLSEDSGGKAYFRAKMDMWFDKITSCNPGDYAQVIGIGDLIPNRNPDWAQESLNISFITRAFWVSPYTMPYWEAGEYFEKQKEVFDILYQAGEKLGVDEETLAQFKCKIKPASSRP